MVLNNKKSLNTILNPWTITGYIEAEGNFSIAVYNYSSRKTRFISFNVRIHSEDIIFLTLLKNYFNCGNISKIDKNGHVTYTVVKIEDINNIIIPFFTKYPLRGTKQLDFLIFVQAANIFNNNNHLTEEGSIKLLELKNQINTNRNKLNFVQPAHTIINNSAYILMNPHYISGFTIGDGHFSLRVNSSNVKDQVFGSLSYGITQHIDNTFLLESILIALNLENLNIHKKTINSIQINISNRNTIKNIIIPFFEKYPLYGMKLIAFTKVKDIILLLDKNSINGRVKWTPELKEQVLNIWTNTTSELNENATLKKKGWE